MVQSPGGVSVKTGRWAALACAMVAVVSLALDFAWVGRLIPGLVVMAAGAVWLLGISRAWRTICQVGFLACLAGSVVLTLLGSRPYLPLLGVCAGLATWDMDYFSGQLTHWGAPGLEPMVPLHVRRLFCTLGLGLLLAVLTSTARVTLSFNAAVILAILLAVALSRAVAFLQAARG